MSPEKRRRTVATAVTLSVLLAARAVAVDLGVLALSAEGALIRFTTDDPSSAAGKPITGTSAPLLGIDFRPAGGRLYAVSAVNDIYTVDPDSGAATLVATLTLPFDAEIRCGFDFNPQSDRLRLVGSNGQNLRAHPDFGATAIDGGLVYGPGDRNAGKRPHLTAAAYTHSIRAAPDTKLFEIDHRLDVLVLQDPPNDGVLATVGPLGVDFGEVGGFDILTDHGVDYALAASKSTLYEIDLSSGKARILGRIGAAPVEIVGLAILPLVAEGAPAHPSVPEGRK